MKVKLFRANGAQPIVDLEAEINEWLSEDEDRKRVFPPDRM